MTSIDLRPELGRWGRGLMGQLWDFRHSRRGLGGAGGTLRRPLAPRPCSQVLRDLSSQVGKSHAAPRPSTPFTFLFREAGTPAGVGGLGPAGTQAAHPDCPPGWAVPQRSSPCARPLLGPGAAQTNSGDPGWSHRRLLCVCPRGRRTEWISPGPRGLQQTQSTCGPEGSHSQEDRGPQSSSR